MGRQARSSVVDLRITVRGGCSVCVRVALVGTGKQSQVAEVTASDLGVVDGVDLSVLLLAQGGAGEVARGRGGRVLGDVVGADARAEAPVEDGAWINS